MNDFSYLVDSNALSKLKTNQRTGTYFIERCRITPEVLEESKYFLTEQENLRNLQVQPTARTLEELQRVMATVKPGELNLVDLYQGKGNADPLLIAFAIELNDPDEPSLFQAEWKIVTDDKGVIKKAQEFSIKTISTLELINQIETHNSDNT